MGKWFSEYQDQFEGYIDEMSSKNKGKSLPSLTYTPQPKQNQGVDKGGALILILGFIVLIMITCLGYMNYEPEKQNTIDLGESLAIGGIKDLQEEMNEELFQEQKEYMKEYGIRNEDTDTDK